MSLAAYAKQNGVKYFLISFVDLFGVMRAKLVPATAIDTVAKSGAGFAGFAVWLGMTPAQALTAATVNAADLLGLTAEVGTLEPGKRPFAPAAHHQEPTCRDGQANPVHQTITEAPQ